MNHSVEISIKTLITIVVFILALAVIFLIRDVLILLFVAFILKSALSPVVNQLEERLRFSRLLAIISLYIILIAILAAVFATILPLFIEQTDKLIKNFPTYVEQLALAFPQLSLRNQDFINTLSSEITSFGSHIVEITLGIFSGVLAVITVVFLTFYFLLDEKNMKHRLYESLPPQYRERTMRITHNVETRLGAWVRGQLMLSFIIGLLYFIGLRILGIQSPLALGLIAAVMEVVPVIGPILAAIPAVLIAFAQSPILALAVVALFFFIQQAENHFIVPKVMQRATGLSPVIVIIAIMVGGRIMGAVGVILAVPVAVVIQEVLFDLWEISRHGEVDKLPEYSAEANV